MADEKFKNAIAFIENRIMHYGMHEYNHILDVANIILHLETELKNSKSEAIRLQQRVDTLEAYIADYYRHQEKNSDGAKRCPFCGEFPFVWGYESNIVVECKNESCPMYYEYYGSIFLEAWNERKI